MPIKIFHKKIIFLDQILHEGFEKC